MKRLLSILIAAVLVFSGCGREKTTQQKQKSSAPETSAFSPAAEVSAADDAPEVIDYKLSDFFPMQKDVHMVYKGTGNEFAGFETYVDYVKDNLLQIRNINGTVSVIVYELTDGMLKKVYTEGEVYHRYDYTSMRNCDEIMLKEPIKAGTQWTLQDGSSRSITALDKEIETPMGHYKALEVTTISHDAKIQEYYVKGMGFVKRIFSSGDSTEVVSEIEKIEKDVPYKHEVSFYFPDFDNDRVVYVNRDVEINTNQDMKFKFQKELKTIPEGSRLSKVLTSGVQINSIKIDKKNKSAIIDFSKELITEMNAGAGLELMILKSIVCTISSYYNVQKVSVTINGEAYSSGHIIINLGEFLNADTSDVQEYKE